MSEARLDVKLARLRGILAPMKSVLVAFSGGADSTFLLAIASDVLGPRNVLAATARSATYPAREFDGAAELARTLGVEQLVVPSGELLDPQFLANPPERCYYCKRDLFTTLLGTARDRGIRYVLDGTNADDTSDYRPGMKASAELGVRHPLLDAGLTKDDIRALSAERGLPTHDKPAAPCLASRIPYGESITEEKLRRIERAEDVLREAGYRELRVRSHGDVARIELGPDEDAAALLAEPTRRRVVSKLKALGYRYVALDMEGYRTGSLNEVLVPLAQADGD